MWSQTSCPVWLKANQIIFTIMVYTVWTQLSYDTLQISCVLELITFWNTYKFWLIKEKPLILFCHSFTLFLRLCIQ